MVANFTYLLTYFSNTFFLTTSQQGVSSWCNGQCNGRWNRSKRVRTRVALLRSLSDEYLWERYEPPYPPSYGLNSITTVLQESKRYFASLLIWWRNHWKLSQNRCNPLIWEWFITEIRNSTKKIVCPRRWYNNNKRRNWFDVSSSKDTFL